MSIASTRTVALAALSLAAVVGCRTIRTDVQTPAGPLQPGPHAYHWVPTPSGVKGVPEADARTLHQTVTAAIENGLDAKGWSQARSADAFTVDYTIQLTPTMRTDRAESDDYVAGLQWSRDAGWKAAPAGADETVLLYDQGTLVIRIANQRGEAVWLGSAAVELIQGNAPRDGKLIEKTVSSLLRRL